MSISEHWKYVWLNTDQRVWESFPGIWAMSVSEIWQSHQGSTKEPQAMWQFVSGRESMAVSEVALVPRSPLSTPLLTDLVLLPSRNWTVKDKIEHRWTYPSDNLLSPLLSACFLQGRTTDYWLLVLLLPPSVWVPLYRGCKRLIIGYV